MRNLPPTIRLFPVIVVILLLPSGVPLFADLAGEERRSPSEPQAEASPGSVLVLVDGHAITQGDLEFMMLSRRVPDELRDSARQSLLDQLIDRRLMQAYLADRNAEPNPLELDAQVERVHELIRKSEDDPQEVLARLGYDEENLKEELALPLAWKTHVRRMVSDQRLVRYFQEHREQFDGTQVRAAHILVQVPADAESDELEAAEERLRQARDEIVSGELTFAEAAERYSDAPSRDRGGDVGFFPYRGRMPQEFSQAAFALEADEVSEPFRTPFGVHLATVTERKPGHLSLEDVRQQVFDRLSNQLWNEIVREQRSKVRIEWKSERATRSAD